MENAIYALIPIVAILAVAGVAIFRPLSKRLADLIDAYTKDRLAGQEERRKVDGLREQLDGLDQRMSLLEERMAFTEDLVGREPPRSLQGPGRRLDEGEAASGEPPRVGNRV